MNYRINKAIILFLIPVVISLANLSLSILNLVFNSDAISGINRAISVLCVFFSICFLFINRQNRKREELISEIFENNLKRNLFLETIEKVIEKPSREKIFSSVIPKRILKKYINDANKEEEKDPIKKYSFFKSIINSIHFINLINKEENKLKTLRMNGMFLQYIKKQTPELCLEAVKQDGFAIYFVKEQREDIVLEAIKKEPTAIRFVKKQTFKICKAALSRDISSLAYIRKITKEIAHLVYLLDYKKVFFPIIKKHLSEEEFLNYLLENNENFKYLSKKEMKKPAIKLLFEIQE